MNWLAHLALSPDDAEDRLGNWLADIMPAHEAAALSLGVARGVERHRRIDLFTDRHPAHLQSRRRFPHGLRRFAGIVVDVAYDHFLSCEFTERTGGVLAEFTQTIYREFSGLDTLLTRDASEVLERMIEEDWLSSYGTLDGVELTLRRISCRLSPRAAARFCPGAARRVVESEYEGLKGDFQVFFPALQAAASATLFS